MTRGAAVDRGTAGAILIARDVRGELKRATRGDELARVVALVGTKGNPPAAGQRGLQHRACAIALGVAVSRCDPKLDQQTVAVLHQGVGRVTRSASFASGSVVD
jgi:hypothetical protein